MIDFVRVGEKIAGFRRDAGMTQDELADKLYVTRQALSKWELGVSAPSIDTLLELCKMFNISFEEILCINEKLEVDKDNIFQGHDRMYIINAIVRGELQVNIPDVFYQFSPNERMIILKNIKEGKLETNINELAVKLTPSELRYLSKNSLMVK